MNATKVMFDDCEKLMHLNDMDAQLRNILRKGADHVREHHEYPADFVGKSKLNFAILTNFFL